MRPRDLRKIATVLLFLLPTAAAAFEWAGRIGLIYDRTDSWYPEQARETMPRLELDLGLQVAGDVVSPGILAWNGQIDYRRDTQNSGAQASVGNTFSYHARTQVFNNRDSPVILSLFADRTDSRAEGGAGTTAVTDQVATAYGGNVKLRGSGIPGLIIGFARSQSEEKLGSLLNHERSVNLVTAGVAHATGEARVNATYEGQWSDGSWVADQNTTNQVGVNAVSNLGSSRDLAVADQYYRRVPTTSASDAFGSEINSFHAFFRDGVVGRMSQITYSDQRAVTVAGGVSEQNVANSLGYGHDFPLSSSEYFMRGTADVSQNEQRRSDAGSLTSRGGTLGAELWWRRVTSATYELAAGPRAGFLQAAGEPIRAGYGVFAHASLAAPWRGRQVSALYDASYGSNVFGREGWTLQQSANGSVAGAAGIGRYNAGFTLAAQRSSTPVFGSSAATSMSAFASYGWRRYSLTGQASLSHGTLPGTSGFVGDGLFIPVGFEMRQTSVSLAGNVTLYSGLSAHANGTYSESVAPGQPSYSAYGASGGLSYRFAAFELSVDDQLTRYRQSSVESSRNLLFVRVSRAFGSRF